jgi:hypothetical protein
LFFPASESPAKPQGTWVKDENGWSVRIKAAAAEKRAADTAESKTTKRSRTENSDENICETLGQCGLVFFYNRNI